MTDKELLAAKAEYLRNPQQVTAEPVFCNCRWHGEQQTQWCALHLAHEKAIYEWAERAKTAEQKLYASPPQQVTAEPVAWIRHEWSRSGNKSLVFERPESLSLIDEFRAVDYEPLYASPPQAEDNITVQEAWKAAGGNPDIKPTKGDLIHTLQTMDAAVDEAAEIGKALT